MKNKTNLFKRIRNIIVGNTLPKNEDLWIDTSNGEKNAVLKYKGNPLIGGGGGGQSNCTNTVKDAKITLQEATEAQQAEAGALITQYNLNVLPTDWLLPVTSIEDLPLDIYQEYNKDAFCVNLEEITYLDTEQTISMVSYSNSDSSTSFLQVTGGYILVKPSLS